MPNKENQNLVKNLKEKFSETKSVIFTDYLGIKSQDANELRQKIRESQAEMLVAKNTLIGVAMKEEGIKNADKVKANLKNSTAVVFSQSDPISIIKSIFEFSKKAGFPKVKSALIEGEYFSTEQCELLNTMPSKQELLGKLVWTLKSPLSGFVSTLGGVQRKFVYVVNAIAQKKGGAN